ncbi:MAG: S41 family peptidase [Ardenticatenaceae bacterium]|nr:S41 family peptidase [Ardenticatenaceae bacterium]MCB9446581.1 S41 family peptidase [Ardenticatenaceae bacterium]
METNDRKSKRSSRAFWIVLIGLTAVAISILTGMAGYALGLSAGSAEVVTEQVPVEVQVEVTREVLVTPEIPPQVPTAPPVLPDAGGNGETASAASDVFDSALFDEVWTRIKQDFDGAMPDDQDLIYGAIEGSLGALDDRFTSFIRPEVAARLSEDMEGAVSGIGAFVNENEEGFFEIVAPIDGQPAMTAGLLPGDIVVAVDGESVTGLSFNEVILLVRGPSGTDVHLTISRADEPKLLEFTITRATFDVPVVESDMLDGDIAYVRLLDFSRNADVKLLAALDELLAQNPRGLILDLRNNPGGFLDQSISIGDIFLPQGVVVYERNRSGLDQTFRADNGDIAETIPLVVLVNEASASAAEIVAGAIQDNGRGTLIGATTFGKGSVQTVHTLSDGSELRVTIARWYTPDNHNIDEAGITPDIEVESPLIIGEDDDPQIQRAVEFLQTGQ